MAKKYKVKTKAVFGDNPPGSTIELSEGIAKKYESIGYLDVISEVKPKPKRKTASKKPKNKEEK